jgi:hypothetical protein
LKDDDRKSFPKKHRASDKTREDTGGLSNLYYRPIFAFRRMAESFAARFFALETINLVLDVRIEYLAALRANDLAETEVSGGGSARQVREVEPTSTFFFHRFTSSFSA